MESVTLAFAEEVDEGILVRLAEVNPYGRFETVDVESYEMELNAWARDQVKGKRKKQQSAVDLRALNRPPEGAPNRGRFLEDSSSVEEIIASFERSATQESKLPLEVDKGIFELFTIGIRPDPKFVEDLGRLLGAIDPDRDNITQNYVDHQQED